MPPKKKGGKGKKGAKKDKETSDGAEALEGKLSDTFNETSQEIYRAQIHDLEQKVERYQEKCNQLDQTNKKLEESFEQQSEDKRELVSFIKKQLKEKTDEVLEMDEQLKAVEAIHETEKMKLELEIAHVKSQMKQTKDKLLSANTVLNGKLAATEEFRQNKDIIVKRTATMEEDMKKQDKDHKNEIYQVERKAVVVQEKIKIDMVQHLSALTNEFRELSQLQMADTTKRTIRENAIINTQLVNLSAKTIELLTENDTLQSDKKALKRTVEILEHNEKEMVKKNVTNKKLIKMMANRSRDQEALIEHYAGRETRVKELENDLSSLKSTIRNFKSSQSNLQQEHDILEKKCEHYEKENSTLDKDFRVLTNVLTDAANVIGQSLQHDVIDSENAAKTENRLTNRLYKILELLDTAVDMGVGIDMEDFNKLRVRNDKRKENVYLGGIANKHKSVYNEMIKPRPHYEPGSLGIIPPATRVFQNETHVSQCRLIEEKYGMYLSFPRELKTRATSRKCKKNTSVVTLPSLTG